MSGFSEYDAARDTLRTAEEYVAGPRSRYYGHPGVNHLRTSILQNAYLQAKALNMTDDELIAAIRGGEFLDAEDVCWLNVQQKLGRDMHMPTADGPIDTAGYAANVAEIRALRAHEELESAEIDRDLQHIHAVE